MGSTVRRLCSYQRIKQLFFCSKFSSLSTIPLQPVVVRRTAVPLISPGGRGSRLAMNSTKSGEKDAKSQDLTVLHNAEQQEFFITLGNEKAVVQYTTLGDGSVDLWHTEVPPAFRDRGIARLLVQAALDHFVNSCTPMVLTCTYIRKFATDFPQPHHQKFIIKGLLWTMSKCRDVFRAMPLEVSTF